jgi:thiamine kinase-like enzyme
VSVRVHEWVDGARQLQHVVYPGDFPSRVGATIARIHALKLDAGTTLADSLEAFGAAHWESLAERVERSDVPWAWQFRWLLGPIADLEAYGVRSRSNLEPLRLSHRDADQKNWMETREGELLLVDWDAAGPVHPRHEVAALALVWGGVGLGEPDRRAARAVIDGYREAGGEYVAQDGDLDEFALVSVGWFEFNVRRAIREASVDEADRTAGEGLVRRGFKDLPRCARSVERWMRLLRET